MFSLLSEIGREGGFTELSLEFVFKGEWFIGGR